MPATDIIAIALAYFAGSVSFAIIVTHLAGTTDPREGGSGNPGATNMITVGGKKLAAVVLLCDIAKSYLPIFAAGALGLGDTTLAVMAVASVIGHLYPVFHRFKGGKGVASCLGTLLAISPLTGLCWIVIWLIVAALSRFSSLGGIVACASAPVTLFFLGQAGAIVLASVVIAIWVVVRHRGNIDRIRNGAESRLF